MTMPKFFRAKPEQWYGIALAVLTISWILARFLCRVGPRLFKYLAFSVTRPLFPRKFLDYFPHFTSLTLFEVGLAIYAISNAVVMSLLVENRTQVGARSGILATINLASLLTGTRLSGVANILGVSLRTQAKIHRSVGFLTLATSIVHIVISILDGKLRWSTLVICGVIVSA